MGLVPIGMTEARLVVANDRIVPIANVKRAVGTEFHIHGPKFAARRTNQRRAIFETESGAIIDNVHAPNGIVDVSAKDEAALPVVRPMRVGDEIAARTFA